MHVLILNQTFHPDTAATAQLMWDLARHLDARGHEVTVVASRVYYGSDRLHDRARQTYGRAITVHRVAGTRFGKSSRAGVLGRASDFASFYVAAAVKMRALPAPDVVLALTSPPMISSLAAALLRVDARLDRRKGRPRPKLACHVMDLFPEAFVAWGVLREGSLVERALGHLAARTLCASDAVIALGRDMRQRIIERCGPALDVKRIHVVTPWAEGDQLRPLKKADNPLAASLGLAETFTVCYSGNLGLAHDLETMAGAIELTRDERGLEWLFIGGGKRFEELLAMARARGWSGVRILPLQPREQLNMSLNLADVHLVSQLPPFTGVVVPSKLFGILAVGRPTVMVGPADAECARVIAENEAGLVVANGDAAGLVAAIKRLRDDPALCAAMGRRARACFEREYDAAVACERIEQILLSTQV